MSTPEMKKMLSERAKKQWSNEEYKRYMIKKFIDFYENNNANIHRGIHKLAEEATLMYEEAHQKVADFINADFEEIIFTKNIARLKNYF